MANRRHSKPPEARTPSREDLLHGELATVVRGAVVGALRPLLKDNPHRLLRTLTPGEVDGMCCAAIAAYVAKRDEMEKREALRDDFDDSLDDVLALN
jgi:hypothetical protein